MTVACILVAAGSGERLGAGLPKALALLAGRPLLWHATAALAASGAVDHVVAVVPAGYEADAEALLRPLAPPARDGALRVVAGQATRQGSVAAGITALPDGADVVLVHDAARCLAPGGLVAAVAAAAAASPGAVVPAVPVVDTLVQVDGRERVVGRPDRSRLRAVQTPQGFRREVLVEAHRQARRRGEVGATDDAGLVGRLGLPVAVLPGDETAFKITTPLDLLRAEALLSAAGRRAP